MVIFLKIWAYSLVEEKSLVAIVYSRRSTRSIDFPQADNFPVAFSARTVVDLFTCFRENPAELEHKKKRDKRESFAALQCFLSIEWEFLKEK